MESKRIEYIDAMRGFTMIIVIMVHVVSSTYQGINGFSWSNFSTIFFMPLFFFISGFILYKITNLWSMLTTIAFLKKKFRVLIVPTIAFLAVTMYQKDLTIEWLMNNIFKAGYWFTIILFVYFCLYAVLSMFIHYIKLGGGGFYFFYGRSMPNFYRKQDYE